MNPRIVAVLVGMGVVIGLLAGLLIGALMFRPGGVTAGPVNTAPAHAVLETDEVELPTVPPMPERRVAPPLPDRKVFVELGDRICQGDEKALPELIKAADDLYQGIDFQRDSKRVMDNLTLMRAAFDPIGQEAGRSNPAAMAALQRCVAPGTHRLSGFATDALGVAATAGNTEALDMLLHYDQFAIPQSSAVGALAQSASGGNAQAIEFLVRVLNDAKARGLWSMASQGLRAPAEQGNAVAAEALKRYDAAAQQPK